MKAWEDMTEIERIKSSYSDLHKDVFGVRPDDDGQDQWSDDQWRDEYYKLLPMLESN